MIKLIDLIENDTTPGEKKKMQNFLYRGSKDQIAQAQTANTDNILDPNHNSFNVVGSKPGTIEGKGPLDTSDHPEDSNPSRAFNLGYPWDFQDPSGIFEDEEGPFQKIRGILIGREFQTMDDIAKMASRLRQAGITQSDIEAFIINYII